jgi:hypothetical protein
MSGILPTQTYHKINRSTDYEHLRGQLKLKHLETKEAFSKKHAQAEKYLREKGIDVGKIRQHSVKVIGAGALTSSLLLSQPMQSGALSLPRELVDRLTDKDKASIGTPKAVLLNNLGILLPDKTRPLNYNEEKIIEQLIENLIGIKARATLEGEHLNTTYGRIGYEQHLKRFPGDTISGHDVQKAGLAPGRGAWGYFADNKSLLTPDLINKEKWYAVVQTMYLPDWNTRQPYLKEWYKYRKVLIVHTENGNAVVAAIADSGPAAWTGKHYGGSPEVMEYLGGDRYKKGEVLLFFVDDPENKVPLGPVEYDKLNMPMASLSVN